MELKIQDLCKSYGKKKALWNFTTEFENGIYGILGPNGAGKSTLMNILTDNLLRDSGSVLYDGEEILNLGASYREIMGYMPQQQQLYDTFTVTHFISYMGTLKGMKQRVLLLQALLNDPKFLILDEPTAGLDPKERIRIRNLISDLSEDRIVLIATHVVSDIEFISKEILLMKNGRLVDQDSPENLQKRIYGHVYELCISQDELAEVKKEYEISNLFRRDGEIIVRVIADKCPVKYDAVKVSPTLEDVYLYEFEGVKRR